MPGRKFSASRQYRYGFNGKENDNEVKGDGNQQDYGMRIYDPRLGKFLSVDPITASYPGLTPYQFASNRPIDGIDLDGLEFVKPLFPITSFPEMRSAAESGQASVDNGGSFASGYLKGYLTMGAKRWMAPIATATGGGAIVSGFRAYSFWGFINALTYNPTLQTEIVGGLAGLVGFEGPDIPGPGSKVGATVRMTWQEVKFVKQNGKVISQEIKATAELIMNQGSSFATQVEKNMVKKLLTEGNSVEILTESTQQGVRTADYLINGIKTELKTISTMTGKDLSRSIKKTIETAFKRQQANDFIIDVSNQKGATKELMDEVLERVKGNNKDKNYSIRAVGANFEINSTNKKAKAD